MTVDAVIWDFGGVITSSPFDAFNRYEAKRGLPHNVIRRINAANPNSNAWALFECAAIQPAEFDALFSKEAAAAGHDIRGSDVLALLVGDVRPRMVVALDRLRAAGVKLGCITNNVPIGEIPGMAYAQCKSAEFAAIMTRFDYVIESSKVGIRKPDPRIYTMMCDALSASPQDCVYLDDLGVNCKPAAAIGMTAIKVESEDQALIALAAATGVDLA